MMELKYDIETIDACPICKKQVKSNFSHNSEIIFSIDCNNCNLHMTETITDNTGGLPVSFISSIVYRYASLIRRWNRRE